MSDQKNSLPFPKSRSIDLNITRTRTIEVLRQLAPDAPARLSTEELAGLMRIKADSVRHSLCLHGHYHGLTPIRLPNGRLIWPIA